MSGYKSLSNVEISDLDRLSLFFGPNAAGKSNLLDALDLLAHLASEDTLAAAFERHRGNRLKRPVPIRWFFYGQQNGQQTRRMEFEVDLELQPRIGESINADLAEREKVAELERAYTRVTRSRLRYSLVLEYLSEARALNVVHESLVPLTKDGTPHDTIVPYIRPDDDSARVSVKLERQSHPRVYDLPRTRTLLSEIRDAVNHPHLVAAARELQAFRIYYVEPGRARTAVNDIIATDPGSSGEQLASFYHWLRREHPMVFENLLENLRNIVPNLERIAVRESAEGFLELWVHERDAGEFPAALVSEGTLRLLCVLGIAATPEPPSVVGYEEPENGVNPARLREMLSVIEHAADSELGTQFLLTTHSPTVLDYFEDAAFFYCRSDEEGSRYVPKERLPLFFKAEVEEVLGESTVSPSDIGTRFARGELA